MTIRRIQMAIVRIFHVNVNILQSHKSSSNHFLIFIKKNKNIFGYNGGKTEAE